MTGFEEIDLSDQAVTARAAATGDTGDDLATVETR